MATSVISFKKVTKQYGHARGISNVSLDVVAGEIFGFLGPNGAGKTTSISLLINLIRPTSGSINIFGLDAQTDAVDIHKRIGFLMDDMALDSGLTGWQQLEYFGHLHGDFNKSHVHELAKRLNCNLGTHFKNLSRGNRQKVGLISALMHNPELLILDEPTSGLDPLMQAEFNKLMIERRAAGKTTFISSHVLSEVQQLCDRVAFIREGKIVSVERVADLATGLPKKVEVLSPDKKLLEAAKKLPGIRTHQADKTKLVMTYSGDIHALLELLAKHNLRDVNIEESDLEAVFMQYYEGAKHV